VAPQVPDPPKPMAAPRSRTRQTSAQTAKPRLGLRTRTAHPPAANKPRTVSPGGRSLFERVRDIAGVAWKAYGKFNQDNIPIVSAGVTFFTLLAVFPGIGAFVALYGLLADVGQARQHLRTLAVVLPPGVVKLIGDEMLRVASAHTGGFSLAFVGGLLLSIWSANGAIKSLFLGMNIANEQPESRGFVELTLITLAFTFGALVVFGLMIAAVVGGATWVIAFGSGALEQVLNHAAWPITLVLALASLALLYRFGPAKPLRPWRFISAGSVMSVVIWMGVSLAFSAYVRGFAHYDRTYGSLGAVVGLMVWLWLSTMIMLGGAELDAEIHRRQKPAKT
jgi:membrane protein